MEKLAQILQLELQQLNLTSSKSVKDFAQRFKQSGRPLHYLILNAG